MFTAGAQCTANFVFTDGTNTYVGYAAHCAGTGGSTDTNGCSTGSLPLGTPVTFNSGANLASEGTQVGTGTLAYSSWLAMQKAGETDANTCAYNDLALVKVDSQYVKRHQPVRAVLGWPDQARDDRHRGRRHGVQLRQLAAARRHRAALAQARRQPRRRRRRLDAHRVHRLAGHPRRLRLGLHGRER